MDSDGITLRDPVSGVFINSGYFFISPLQEFPTTQQPEVFGMHENVDISKELQETKQIFDSVLLTLGSQVRGIE